MEVFVVLSEVPHWGGDSGTYNYVGLWLGSRSRRLQRPTRERYTHTIISKVVTVSTVETVKTRTCTCGSGEPWGQCGYTQYCG